MSGFFPDASIVSFYIASTNVTVDVLAAVRVALLMTVLALCLRRIACGQQASAAVVLALNPRLNRPEPTAAPCPGGASGKLPSHASPGSAGALPLSSLCVSASSSQSCAAASARSNQSAAPRAAPMPCTSPTANKRRKGSRIGVCRPLPSLRSGISAARTRAFCEIAPSE